MEPKCRKIGSELDFGHDADSDSGGYRQVSCLASMNAGLGSMCHCSVCQDAVFIGQCEGFHQDAGTSERHT